MYLDFSTIKKSSGNGAYRRVLLRTSFREAGKVKHRTLGNLSDCSDVEINAVKLALQFKGQLSELIHRGQAAQSAALEPQNPVSAVGALPKLRQGPSVGAVLALKQVAEETGVAQALGSESDGMLALWQVIARALEQGSRLSSVRLARDIQAQASLPGLPDFTEDDLYDNLAWLTKNQQRIENAVFAFRQPLSEMEHKNKTVPQNQPGPTDSPQKQTGMGKLYLYDVTSTYLEGEHNALANYGYNRDGKRGKMQLVVGLLCTADGLPVSIEAFEGNTADPLTVASQIEKLKDRFRADQITLVGDRGMIRGPQQKALSDAGFHFITAITKPQIETLLKRRVMKTDLFDENLAELVLPIAAAAAEQPNAEIPDQPIQLERYVFRRNPTRQAEMAANRTKRQERAMELSVALTKQLEARPKSSEESALAKLNKKIKTLKLHNWLKAVAGGRKLLLQVDAEALNEEAKLDGCYVIKTDLTRSQASKETVHASYKSLADVETAFRRSKTVELEMRPVYVRKESSSRGHLLVVMLAYLLMAELGKRWANLDVKVSEGLGRLHTYCAVEIGGVISVLLEPREDVKNLLDAGGIKLPTSLTNTGAKSAKVATKTALPKHRPKRSKSKICNN